MASPPIGVTPDGLYAAASDDARAAVAQLERWRITGYHPTATSHDDGWTLMLTTEDETVAPRGYRTADDSGPRFRFSTGLCASLIDAVKVAQEVIK